MPIRRRRPGSRKRTEAKQEAKELVAPQPKTLAWPIVTLRDQGDGHRQKNGSGLPRDDYGDWQDDHGDRQGGGERGRPGYSPRAPRGDGDRDGPHEGHRRRHGNGRAHPPPGRDEDAGYGDAGRPGRAEPPHAPDGPEKPAGPDRRRRPDDRAGRTPEDRRGLIPPPPPVCSGRLYQIRPGDTLFRLAGAFGVSVEEILAANPQVTDPDVLSEGQVICIPGPVDSVKEILDTLLTAEKVETALYAKGLVSKALRGLPPEQFAYFQAGLSHERAHIAALERLGASVPYEEFFYPPGVFDDLNLYVNTLLTLETAGVAAYIQASDELARMGRFDLARLMARIMGVEAEHRALLREVLNLVPASNLCCENAPNQPVPEILSALPAFLQPNQFDGRSVGPVRLPTDEEAETLIGPHGCPNPRPDLG